MLRRQVPVQLLFIALSVLYVFMLAPRGVLTARDSLDAYFHLTRIRALNGVWQSPINFFEWNHLGNATSLFYPWLTVVIGYPLFHFFGVVHGYLVFMGLVTYATLLAAYVSYRKFRHTEWPAILFALVYTFSFVRASNVLYRWGVGEFMAMIFIPPLFLAFYAVLKGHWASWPYAALWFSLIIYSHVLSAVIIGVNLLVLFLAALVVRWGVRSYWRQLFLRAVQFGLTALLLTMAYWGPMVEQQLYQPLNRPAVFNMIHAGQSLPQLLNSSLRLDVRSYALGVFLLVILVGVVLTIWFTDWVGRTMGLMALVMLVLSSTTFPWGLLQNTPVNIIQYPGRFLGMVMFWGVLYLVYMLETRWQTWRVPIQAMTTISIGAIAVGLFVGSACALWHTNTIIPANMAWITNDNAPARLRAFNQRDYYPVRAVKDAQSIEAHETLLNDQVINAPLHYSQTAASWQVHLREDGRLDLPVLRFKGTRTWVDGELRSSSASPRGTAQIAVTKGAHRIVVAGSYTWFAKFSILTSVITAGLLGTMLFVRKHRA